MTPERIAGAFRAARQSATSLNAFPGTNVPTDLDAAYAVQEFAISAWPDSVAGWKVAAIQAQWRDRYASERLAGPIFSKNIWSAGDGKVSVPVIRNGYAAVEAEFAIRLSGSIPGSALSHDAQELLPYIEGVYAALELAASPLATLSSLGPGAVVSDFGNNSGLVTGAKLPTALLMDPASSSAAVEINGSVVGQGDAARIPGGPLSALQFLVKHLAARGRTLGAGDWISTGASTGIHLIQPGDCVRAIFNSNFSLVAEVCEAGAAN